MTVWNYDITEAPKEGPVWMASKCGKVIKSRWLAKTRFGPARWDGFNTSTDPVAWAEYVVPEHPGLLVALDESATVTLEHLHLDIGVGGNI